MVWVVIVHGQPLPSPQFPRSLSPNPCNGFPGEVFDLLRDFFLRQSHLAPVSNKLILDVWWHRFPWNDPGLCQYIVADMRLDWLSVHIPYLATITRSTQQLTSVMCLLSDGDSKPLGELFKRVGVDIITQIVHVI